MKRKRYVPALAAMVLWLCSSVINAPGQTSSRDDELPRNANEIIGKVGIAQ